uniref:Uncharacterized protein n=1 Tax=Sphaerodactylus townsendi TaxID=933632 RepID=A0ACB8EFJ0_9SAUR
MSPLQLHLWMGRLLQEYILTRQIGLNIKECSGGEYNKRLATASAWAVDFFTALGRALESHSRFFPLLGGVERAAMDPAQRLMTSEEMAVCFTEGGPALPDLNQSTLHRNVTGNAGDMSSLGFHQPACCAPLLQLKPQFD